jgi:hypothetical protein
MRSRSVAVAMIVTTLASAGAVGCYFQAQRLRTEGRWLLERSAAEAESFAATLDGAAAEAQLHTFEERRGVLERAHLWHRGQLLLILVAVGSAFCCYALVLYRRLREELQEVVEPGTP